MLNLLATILLCMGLANVSPFNHAKEETARTIHPKKANETNDYSLDINYYTETNETFGYNTPIPNTYYPISNFRNTRKYKIVNTNNFINVVGTIYRQTVMTETTDENNVTENTNVYMNINAPSINNNLNYLIRERTEMLYCYKLTPYNYNINNNIVLKTIFNIEEWTNQNDIDWYTYQVYVIRNIYKQIEPIQNKDLSRTWDRYIDQQITEYQAYNIARDIENVDNGFYYTKEQELLQIGYNTTNIEYTDTIQLEISPTNDNYIFIEYIPVVRAVNMGDNQNLEQVVPQKGTIRPSGTNNKLNGTNIIPSGTYEVVNIPGLMFDVLTMPFAFVSQAFNLTLFPGTPYQINIANLFLSIIAILVFVWLMKKFTKL